MTFPLDDIYLGPASFGPLHRLDGIIWHTGEESGFTRAHAVATANWQKTNPGSYNFRIYDDGVMCNVLPSLASGGVNPASSSWAPEAWLKFDLPVSCSVPGCPGPFLNPTMHHIQASFVGKTADLEAGLEPANYAADGRRLIEWADTQPNRGPRPLVNSKHEDWQSNRSDPGDRIMALILEDDVIVKTPIRRAEWWTKIGPASTFTRSDGTQGHFTARERVTSIADLTLDDGTRGLLLCYGDKHEALVMSRGGADGPPITESLGCGSGSDATCQAELASAKQTIEAQTDIIAEQKTRITAAKVALG